MTGEGDDRCSDQCCLEFLELIIHIMHINVGTSGYGCRMIGQCHSSKTDEKMIHQLQRGMVRLSAIVTSSIILLFQNIKFSNTCALKVESVSFKFSSLKSQNPHANLLN